MKRAFLILRIPFEALVGLLCFASGLVLLLWTVQGYFPAVMIVGYLGMPRHVVSSVPEDVAAASRHANEVFRAIGFVIVTAVMLSALLWLRDVARLVGRIRTRGIR